MDDRSGDPPSRVDPRPHGDPAADPPARCPDCDADLPPNTIAHGCSADGTFYTVSSVPYGYAPFGRTYCACVLSGPEGVPLRTRHPRELPATGTVNDLF